MKKYSDLYSWRYPVDEYCIGHHDGVVSIAIGWEGYRFEMLSDDQKIAEAFNLYQLLSRLNTEWVVEFHLFREYDHRLAEKYLAKSGQFQRAHEFGGFLREQMAHHVAAYGMTNTPCIIVTTKPQIPAMALFKPKLDFEQQARRAETLRSDLEDFLRFLPKAHFLGVDDYWDVLVRSSDRDRHRTQGHLNFDGRFHINDVVAATKPEWTGQFLKLGETYTWVGLLDIYPTQIQYPGWVEPIFGMSGCEFHCSQIVKGTNTNSKITKSADEFAKEKEALGQRGADFARGKLQGNRDFRQYVTDNDLAIVENAWVLHIHSLDETDLKNTIHAINTQIESQGGRFQSNRDLSYAFWRVAQPGQGYQSRFFRDDAHDLVVNMCPVTTFDQGVEPELLRLTAQNQLVGLGNIPDAANHGFKAAKTRSGKGVEDVAEIAETYPLGVNHYIAEVGPSHKWIVEAFGGDYLEIDPENMVINPFPNYSEAVYFDEDNDRPLPTLMVSTMMTSLAFVLTNGVKTFEALGPDGQHIKTRADIALQALYSVAIQSGKPGDEAPTFVDYFEIIHALLDQAKAQEDEQDIHCYAFLYKNLESFLNSSAGRIYDGSRKQMNLNGSLVGVDFYPLTKTGDSYLSNLYLTSTLLRTSQLAMSESAPAFLRLDELHEFSRMDPEQVSILCNQIARMGGKANAYLMLISQALGDIDLTEGVTQSMLHKELLYMESGHQEITRVYDIPQKAIDVWRSFPDPKAAGLDYRQAVRFLGDNRFFNLHLTFPQVLLDLADTSRASLDLKDEIEKITSDPWERLRLFREKKEQHHA
ncbi:hypothetical protein [Reinekea blandensis]|uniref:Uncharacterized protein n=1 Tax=Reinekea blandensis MED297 TaxID=314283 RepID=A4BJX4_9GAMM|nr:hypothetical protein [Reinekea blandensis]EAR07575.1 hypothetical protein MED297_00100 [Reinekea sp. MED297] [Reinekea blandensis MED297]